MENFKNKFECNGRLEKIQKKMNISNQFFDELTQLNKTTESLQLGFNQSEIIYINHKLHDFNNNNVIFKKCILEILSSLHNSNQLFQYNNLICPLSNNNIVILTTHKLYHLSFHNYKTQSNSDLIDNIKTEYFMNNQYHTQINMNEYINNFTNHLDKFNNFVNKYNLPENWSSLINNHNNILTNVYTIQIEYNKINDNIIQFIDKNLKCKQDKSEMNTIKKTTTNTTQTMYKNNLQTLNIQSIINSNKVSIDTINRRLYTINDNIYKIKTYTESIDYKQNIIYILLLSSYLLHILF